MTSAIFTNDNNVSVILPENNDDLSRFSKRFATRDQHEVLFRKIVTYMINNGMVDKDKNIVDLGAWIGDNAIPWAKNINGVVYAIDPSEKNCNYINILAKTNNIKNVVTIQKAISSKQQLLSTNDGLEHCSLSSSPYGKNKVTSTNLDTLNTTNAINNVGFIHLDVEGLEGAVILGAQRLINESKPIITFEQHLEYDNYLGITHFLTKFGYDSYLINEILPGCRPDCRNILALPNNQYDQNKLKEMNSYLEAHNKEYTKATTSDPPLVTLTVTVE